MPISLLFWVLMVLWLVLGFGWTRRSAEGDFRVIIGGNLLLFILLFLLGRATFGFVLTR
ncbi:MAG TPA: hypothetical protein VFQ43_03015 [Nitrososphaera sp.]|nr:hypothetical protein [Nitrososphaera sp.]